MNAQASKDSQTEVLWPLYNLILRVGMFVYPAFYILDRFAYPGQAEIFLAIRCIVTVHFFVAYRLIRKTCRCQADLILLSCLVMASAGISWMCFLSGEGFDSIYFVGLLQVIIFLAPLLGIPSETYIIAIGCILTHHFALLAFDPGSLRGFIINFFALAVFAVMSIFSHRMVCQLYEENKSLRGILPICAHCKKIRDDEGYWRDVALYISQHSEAQFSHGLCPDCIKNLYPDLDINLDPVSVSDRPAK